MADGTGPVPWSLKYTSLAAATATGAGAQMDASGSRTYTLDVRTTGSPASFTVALEGTLDGTNWTSIGTTSTTGRTRFADSPVKTIRANLTALSGGTSPTVTAVILMV